MKTVAAEKIGPARLVAVGTSERTPLCDLLVENGKLESPDVERALRLQREQDDWERVGSILVKLGLVSDVDVAQGLAIQLDMPLVDRADFPDEVQDECDIAQRFLKKNKTLVLGADSDELVVAMADPLDDYVIEALSLVSGRNVIPRIGVPSDIEAALESLYDASGTGSSGDVGNDSARYLDDVEQLKELAGEAPVI